MSLRAVEAVPLPIDHRADPVAAARRVAAAAAGRAPGLDREGAFPAEDVADLAAAGLLAAPVPAALGGIGLGSASLGSPALLDVLRLVGRGSLPLGRLYEGHVNAWRLIARHGDEAQRRRFAADALAGHMFGVWNTGAGIRLEPAGAGFRLEGGKVLCSGAGHITRPLITARQPDGGTRLVVVPLERDGLAARADPAQWRPQGMRASASGGFDFSGIVVGPDCLLGGPGVYETQPDFSAGAWRFAAVQLGGIEAVVDGAREHLRRLKRDGDPHQRARIGKLATAAVTARLWLERAADVAADAEADPEGAVAFVNLARLAVEQAGLDAIGLAQRSVGLQAFLEPHPLELAARDLATYLRQPNPDGALDAAAGEVQARDEGIGEMWRRG